MRTMKEDMRDAIADIVNHDRNPLHAHRGRAGKHEVGPGALAQREGVEVTLVSPRCEGHSSPTSRPSR